MELAQQIVTYVEETLNSEEIDTAEQSEEQEPWEPIKGVAKAFPLLDKVLEVPENMDVFNSYRLRFRDLAFKYADKAEKEYKTKVRDLLTFLEFFPRIYGHYLDVLVQKATDILISEEVWTVTAD